MFSRYDIKTDHKFTLHALNRGFLLGIVILKVEKPMLYAVKSIPDWKEIIFWNNYWLKLSGFVAQLCVFENSENPGLCQHCLFMNIF